MRSPPALLRMHTQYTSWVSSDNNKSCPFGIISLAHLETLRKPPLDYNSTNFSIPHVQRVYDPTRRKSERAVGSPLRGQRDRAYSIRGVRRPPPPHARLAAPGRLLLLFAETKSSAYHKSRKKEKNIFFPKSPADKPFLYSMKFKYIEKSNGDSNT